MTPEGKSKDLAATDVIDPEQFLLRRLQQHGLDVYAPPGPFACLRDRLAHVILDNRHGPVVAGRHEKRPETYEQLFTRIYGIQLKDVPRGTNSNTKQSNTG